MFQFLLHLGSSCVSVHCVPLCVCVCPFSVSMSSFLCFIPCLRSPSSLPPLPHPLRCVSVCLSYLVLCLSPCVASHLPSLMSVICFHVCVYYFQARVCLSGSHCICHFLSYFVMCVMFGFASSVSLCLISCVSLLFLQPCVSAVFPSVQVSPSYLAVCCVCWFSFLCSPVQFCILRSLSFELIFASMSLRLGPVLPASHNNSWQKQT